MTVSLEEIQKARETLSGVICRTGLVYTNIISEMSGNHVYLKMENLQRTGSFKLRGAYNKIANLSEGEKINGVIASSAGNHAQGVALAATTFGIKSTIVNAKARSFVKGQCYAWIRSEQSSYTVMSTMMRMPKPKEFRWKKTPHLFIPLMTLWLLRAREPLP